jgi:pimeloyl-ACP methyl ester carboxylesterase
MKKSRKKTLVAGGIVMGCWLLFAQSCMKFRITDAAATASFEKSGVPIRLLHTTIADQQLHYAITGSDANPTLFFMHGSPGSWDAFAAYMKDTQLLQRFRMVSIDRPGFGYSRFGRAYSLKKQASVIGSLIGQLQNGRPFYLVGHSLGGPLAVMLGAHYRDDVNGLVLLAASVDPTEEKPERWRPWLKAVPVRWFVPGAFRPSNTELWDFKKDVLEMPQDLDMVRCPVYIVQGSEDDLVPPGNALYAQRKLVHAATVQLVMLQGANHFIPWTHYSDIKKVLLQLP